MDVTMIKKSIQQLFGEYIYQAEFVQLLRPKTLQDYKENFDLLIRLQPDISVENLTPHIMAQFFKQLQERSRIVGKAKYVTGVKKSTIITYWNKYNRFFTWLVQNRYIERNPLYGLKRPHLVFDSKKFLDKEEIEKILTAILLTSNSSFLLKRNLVIFYLFLFCGLRCEELLLLQVRDIDLTKKMLTVRATTSKVERSRLIPLQSQLIVHLKDYLQERKNYKTAYLIVSRNRDSGFTYAGLKHLVDTLHMSSGVNFHVHQLRHTFAVNFLNYSNNIAKLQQLLGHTNPSMTLQYTRCLPPSAMRSDLENMRIDKFL
jgi:integrase/recombinase XerD